MKFVILGVLVILLITFFVLVWKASRNWRWYQIVPACFLMLFTILFLFPTAGVLKSRSAWHQVKEKLEKRAAEVIAENKVIKYGDVTSGKGVVELNQQLAKLGIEAGRSWRGLRFTQGNAQSFTLTSPAPADAVPGIPPEEPAEGAEPVAPLPLIPEGMVVYGFREAMNQQTQLTIPVFYLGEFQVSGSTPTQVTLTPTTPLQPAQLQAINGQQARQWSIYELLPLDGHAPFIAEGSVPDDDNVLGRVDDALIKQLVGNKVLPGTLKSYLEDGRRATQDDPPLSRWTKIEFLKNHSIQVDSLEQRGALNGGFFDGSGRAVDARLQRGEKGSVSFKKGDQILVQEAGANGLIDEGVGKLIDRYYLRPLNDYRFVLRHIPLRLSELSNRSSELAEEKQTLSEAIDKSNGMLVANNETKIKLEQDLAQFEVEKKAIDAYAGELQQTVAATKKQMAVLHKKNQILAERIEELSRRIERETESLISTSR